MLDFNIQLDIFRNPTKCIYCNNRLILHLDNTGVSTICSKCGQVDSVFNTEVRFIRVLGGN